MSLLWGEMPPIPVQIGPSEETMSGAAGREADRDVRILIALDREDRERRARGETIADPSQFQTIAMARRNRQFAW